MKFSFNLIKKLAPGQYDEKLLTEKLNLHSFETTDLGNGVLDISVPANRFSDIASHLGVALEVSVIFKTKLSDFLSKMPKFDSKLSGPSVEVQDKNLCPRYMAAFVSGVKVGPSPKWLKDILEDCGIRSINNVVDVMNYVMLEIGQPMHAFDADKLKGGIVVRKAKKGEKIETIDGQKFDLDSDTLVIADSKQPLAIAGIKGGKSSEVTDKTKNILVEAANFNGVNIYKSSRRLGLRTDASNRFMHDLSPALVEMAMHRALALLRELATANAGQADGKDGKPTDVYPKKQSKKLLELNTGKINKLIGYDFNEKELADLFSRLGFKLEGKLWQVPEWRMDINNLEDLAEEVARFSDYNKLPALPPAVALGVAEEAEEISLVDKVSGFLKGAGFSESYNYSFISKEEAGALPKGIFGAEKPVELLNPISNQSAYLRDSLAPGLLRNLKDNSRFYSDMKIFEMGKIFGEGRSGVKETLALSAVISGKNSALEIKGLADSLFTQLGLTEYLTPDLNIVSDFLKSGEALRIETPEHQVLGYLGSLKDFKNGAIMEIDLEKLLKEVDEEREFEPIAKYPAIERDISILVSKSVRTGPILNFLYSVSPKLVEDVDLIDYYEDSKLGANHKSLTFRIVFRSEDHTLTDPEADREIAIINQILTDKFNAELR
ncbi:MAG: phenylalanine--tRNA ligase subunit beta [bacterium]|nr:phenylalanine--tRNA ligase subunit beta [bacterium]